MRRRYFRQRWMALPWGVIGLVLAAVFGWIAVEGLLHPEDGPTVRIAVPLYLLGVYGAVAALVNMRSVLMTPKGIWTVVWPLPAVLPLYTKRENILFCFVRRVVVRDENGVELERYSTVGVETKSGRQIDLSGPHMKVEEAWAAAGEIAGFFRETAGEAVLLVREIPQIPSRRQLLGRLAVLLFWTAVALFLIFVGVMWDLRFDQERRDARSIAPTPNVAPAKPRR